MKRTLATVLRLSGGLTMVLPWPDAGESAALPMLNKAAAGPTSLRRAVHAGSTALTGIRLALLALALAASGCLHDDGSPGYLFERIALSQAQQRWQASGIVFYDYYLRKTCFCPGGELGGGREVLISIRNDVIERITYADTGEDVPASQYEFYATVPDLFETIRGAIDASSDSIQAEYDPALGYPSFVFIDHYRGAADDEVSYDARDLTAI